MVRAVKIETLEFFESQYKGEPSWNIGMVQPSLLDEISATEIVGRSIDIGCGVGDCANYLASLGYESHGVDISKTAIAKAIINANKLHLSTIFHLQSAFSLEELGLQYNLIIDCGLMHIMSDNERRDYIHQLNEISSSESRLILIGFDTNLLPNKPRGFKPQNLIPLFENNWDVETVREINYCAAKKQDDAPGWLMQFRRH
jgi:SAM-dependent methyltransferase